MKNSNSQTAERTALSRRQFLMTGAVAGTGLIVTFTLPKALAAAMTDAGTAALKQPAFSPNAFIRVDDAGQVSFVMHKVEMGQGTFTSMSMLLAEELEVDLHAVTLIQAPPNSALYANSLIGGQATGGSTSVRDAWVPLRTAGATARTMLISAAAQRWKVDTATCIAKKGVVSHAASGRTLAYGALADEAGKLPVPKNVPLKDARDFKLIGTAVKRLDSSSKVNGTTKFGMDVRLPGMGVAAITDAPVIGGKLKTVDEAKAMAVKGVRQVVRLDNAVAVVADHMWAAKQGLLALNPTWDDGANADFTSAVLTGQMDAASKQAGAVARNDGDAHKVISAAAAEKKIEAVYQLPLLAHAMMEPMNCTIELKKDGCEVWVGTQAPANVQAVVAKVVGLAVDKVQVHNHYLGGGFGRRFDTDCAEQVALFAKQIKGPVKFVWTREQDIQHAQYRPAYYDRLGAVLDDNGMPLAWTHRVTGSSIFARVFPPAVKNGIDRDAVDGAADMPYAVPNVHVDYVRHEPPVVTTFWRGVGPTHNIFVVESFIDELAAKAGKDPFEYRRALLQNAPREKAVLELVAQKAGWGTPAKAADGTRSGRGIAVQFAFGSYAAMVADVEVSPQGEVAVKRLVCVVDCGQTVNPDTIKAQIEGGSIFGVTGALWSEITFDKGGVQQSNFHNYRVLRMNESPKIEVYIVPSTEAPGGIGEVGTAITAPALANAVFAATGTRIRQLPFTRENLQAT